MKTNSQKQSGQAPGTRPQGLDWRKVKANSLPQFITEIDRLVLNEVDKGGHFAAWEQPQRFSEEIRAAFRSLRESWPAALIRVCL
jgi:pimeloyl-ACP methyl ester carboxylesterase